MSLCCNAHQIDVIVAVCAYTVLILGTWRVDAVVMRAAGASSGSSFLWACGRGASATSCCTLGATSISEGLASTTCNNFSF